MTLNIYWLLAITPPVVLLIYSYFLKKLLPVSSIWWNFVPLTLFLNFFLSAILRSSDIFYADILLIILNLIFVSVFIILLGRVLKRPVGIPLLFLVLIEAGFLVLNTYRPQLYSSYSSMIDVLFWIPVLIFITGEAGGEIPSGVKLISTGIFLIPFFLQLFEYNTVQKEVFWDVIFSFSSVFVYFKSAEKEIGKYHESHENLKRSLNIYNEVTASSAKIPGSFDSQKNQSSIINDIMNFLRSISAQIESDAIMVFLQDREGSHFQRWDTGKKFYIPGYDSVTDLYHPDFTDEDITGPVYFENSNEDSYRHLLLIPLFLNKKISAIIVAGRETKPFIQKEIEQNEILSPLFSYLLFGKISIYNDIKKLISKNKSMIAMEIQKQLLINGAMERDNFSLALFTESSEGVSSDLHGYFIDEVRQTTTFYICDIIGKNDFYGSQAIIVIRTIFELLIRNRNEIEKILKIINQFIIKDSKLENFAQMNLVQVDETNRKARICSAGYGMFFVFRLNTQKVEQILNEELAIGVDERSLFKPVEIEIFSGDIIVTCTDGILETMNELNQHFGSERLIKIICENYFLSVKDLKDKIFQEVSLFRGIKPVHDDRTIGIIKIY